MSPSFTYLLALLATLTLAATDLHTRQTNCDQSPTNFLIYTNTTGSYGALGHPCRRGPCGLFFSVAKTEIDTYYNLTNSGRLVVSRSGQPTNPVGVIAGASGLESSVEFGTKKYFQAGNSKPLSCSIEPSPNADTTCDLVCKLVRPQVSSAGQSYDTSNYYKTYLGDGGRLGDTAFEIKVDFNV